MILRRGILLVVAAAAVTAVLAGLARFGVVIGWGAAHAVGHGPLFVLGVFGTVIALERAVAIGTALALVAPGLGAVAAVAMLTHLSWAPWAAAASGLALVFVNAAIVRRQAVAFTWLMLVASVLLGVGETAWALGRPLLEVLPTWLAFFVLTIVAERLELSRLAPTPRWANHLLIALGSVLAASACGLLVGSSLVSRGLGVAMVGIGLWQLRFDLARRTLRRAGLPRFTAVAVLAGACWLLPAGWLSARGALPPAGPIYDATLHAVFVGYVLSMVFAHAPIILPAVARVRLPFSRVLYLPLVVLHLSVAARIVGDLAAHASLRRVGAIGNALAIAAFAVAVLYARSRRGASHRSSRQSPSNKGA